MRTYNQLTQTERYQIYALRKANKNPTEISRILGRHKSTIYRELKRNLGKRGTVLSKHINLLLNDT